MSQSDSDECFVLHQRSYSETSIIAEIFTRKNGKVSMIAKGAKKPKSKFFGYLVPFHKLNINFSGRSELKTITNIDRDLTKTDSTLTKTSYSLLYVNELLIKLLPKDAQQEELFLLYEKFLNAVNKKNNLELALRNFELDLLDMLGYGFDFNYEIENQAPIESNSHYLFVSERGFKKTDRSNLLGKDIINMKHRKLEMVPSHHLKEITKKAISMCLDGKDLSSREIFKSLKK